MPDENREKSCFLVTLNRDVYFYRKIIRYLPTDIGR